MKPYPLGGIQDRYYRELSKMEPARRRRAQKLIELLKVLFEALLAIEMVFVAVNIRSWWIVWPVIGVGVVAMFFSRLAVMRLFLYARRPTEPWFLERYGYDPLEESP